MQQVVTTIGASVRRFSRRASALLVSISVTSLSASAFLAASVLLPASPAGASGPYVSTIVGIGAYGNSGSGGPALSAEIEGPNALALDSSGDLFTTSNSEVLETSASTGFITPVAGYGPAVARVTVVWPQRLSLVSPTASLSILRETSTFPTADATTSARSTTRLGSLRESLGPALLATAVTAAWLPAQSWIVRPALHLTPRETSTSPMPSTLWCVR